MKECWADPLNKGDWFEDLLKYDNKEDNDIH